MTLLRDSGVVLRTYRLGEADRIVVLVTEAHGKVRAVAKGVRKTTSKWGGRLEPLSHVALLLWQGRGDLAVVNQAEVVDHFPSVRDDLERIACGLSMLEVVDQLALEGHPDPGLYRMLVGALRALADQRTDPVMLVPAFFLKLLAHEGTEPVLYACAACARPEGEVELVAFDATEGGTLCRQCRRGRAVSPDALAVVRSVLGGALGQVLSSPPPACAGEVAGLATEAMEAHIDRRLRTVRMAAGLTW
ncbi:MAG: DNA repair protein RecO [Acidimicrobiales bacterium]